MKKFALGLAVVAGMSLAASGGAMAELKSGWEDMSKSGKHQFYVWCTGKDSYEATADGSNAKDAQAKLASEAGNTCWPVWQGLTG